jgi:hypothetical protein
MPADSTSAARCAHGDFGTPPLEGLLKQTLHDRRSMRKRCHACRERGDDTLRWLTGEDICEHSLNGRSLRPIRTRDRVRTCSTWPMRRLKSEECPTQTRNARANFVVYAVRSRNGGRDRDRTCDPYHVKVGRNINLRLKPARKRV